MEVEQSVGASVNPDSSMPENLSLFRVAALPRCISDENEAETP